MTIWTVTGYRRVVVAMKVEAETEAEAIERAKMGEYTDVDTEPGENVYKPNWKAQKA